MVRKVSLGILACLVLLGSLDCQGGKGTSGDVAPGPGEVHVTDEVAGEDQPADTVTAPASGMTTPTGQTASGLEVFISIGGIGQSSHQTVLQKLVAGYTRAGFRVHYIIEAGSFSPFAAKLASVAAEYRNSGTNLNYVVFHHTGHGWYDHISYQDFGGQDKGTTDHSEIAAGLGLPFPSTVPGFSNTRFGMTYDACGQGRATNHQVPGRGGFVATSTPDAAPPSQCLANTCLYECSACRTQLAPGYVYSPAYGDAIQSMVNQQSQSIEAALEAAHGAGKQALGTAGAPGGGCLGKFTRY